MANESSIYPILLDIMKNPGQAQRDMQDYFSSFPKFESEKDILDYYNRIRSGKYQDFSTPGINPEAKDPEPPKWNPVEEMKQRYEGSPADQVSSSAFGWIENKATDIGFIVLGVVIVGVALTMVAKKQVIEVVKGAAVNAIGG